MILQADPLSYLCVRRLRKRLGAGSSRRKRSRLQLRQADVTMLIAEMGQRHTERRRAPVGATAFTSAAFAKLLRRGACRADAADLPGATRFLATCDCARAGTTMSLLARSLAVLQMRPARMQPLVWPNGYPLS